MKTFKILSALVAATLLLTPACACAKTSFSFSLNLVDFLRPACPPPVMVPPPPPAVYYYRPPVPYYHKQIVEYHHYYHPRPQVEEINSPHKYPPYNPYHP